MILILRNPLFPLLRLKVMFSSILTGMNILRLYASQGLGTYIIWKEAWGAFACITHSVECLIQIFSVAS